jgi:hypothetical protein
VESEGSRRQKRWLDEQKSHMRRASWMRRQISSKSDTCTESLSVNAAMVGKTVGANGEVAATGQPGSKVMQDLMGRALEIQEAGNGMNYLANQTGGFLVSNNNDIAQVQGIRRVLDQKGYYLIGYRPSEATFDPATRFAPFKELRWIVCCFHHCPR